MAELPGEFFAPEPLVAPVQDDLGLDAKSSQDSPKPSPFKAPTDTGAQKTDDNAPTLAKEAVSEDGADEEAFYLEPVE